MINGVLRLCMKHYYPECQIQAHADVVDDVQEREVCEVHGFYLVKGCILSKFFVSSLFLNLKRHERATMVGWQMAADVCAAFLIAFVFDSAVLMELGHEVAALVGNKHVEGNELAYQIVADTAQEIVNSLPLQS